jgi:hypothetical protein
VCTSPRTNSRAERAFRLRVGDKRVTKS